MKVPHLSKVEYLFICHIWDDVNLGSFVRKRLKLSKNEFNKIVTKLIRKKIVEKGDFPNDKKEDYFYHITNIGVKVATYYNGIYGFPFRVNS